MLLRLKSLPRRPAFSLLEMMIVLAILAGMMALAWPSLRRPMEESAVQQAAAELREQIAECRYQAAVHGQLVLIRFEAETSSFEWGPWQALMANELEVANSRALVSNRLAYCRAIVPNRLAYCRPIVPNRLAYCRAIVPNRLAYCRPIVPNRLAYCRAIVPNRLEFYANSWGQLFYKANSWGQQFYIAKLSESEPATWSLPAGMIFERVSLGAAAAGVPADAGETRWYLPLLPDGQTRDAAIVLRDQTTGQRALVRVDAVTGMMQTERLPAAVADSELP
ncbi:pilus assembly FimT family protein [Planctomycetaceae bacterium SH139]